MFDRLKLILIYIKIYWIWKYGRRTRTTRCWCSRLRPRSNSIRYLKPTRLSCLWCRIKKTCWCEEKKKRVSDWYSSRCQPQINDVDCCYIDINFNNRLFIEPILIKYFLLIVSRETLNCLLTELLYWSKRKWRPGRRSKKPKRELTISRVLKSVTRRESKK